MAAFAMPASIAAWMICDSGPLSVGTSDTRCAGSTCDAGMRTASSTTVPLAVVRCPNPDQSSITVSPGVGCGTYASQACCASSSPSTGT